MSLSDIDLSPGFVTQLSVTPTLHETTSQGKKIIVDMIKIMKYKSILYHLINIYIQLNKKYK